MAGNDEMLRILRELFERTNNMQRASTRTISILRNFSESFANRDESLLDGTQPSATPKWAAAGTWSRADNHIRWTEGALWR